MKKIIILSLIFISLLVVGCQDQETTATATPETAVPTEVPAEEPTEATTETTTEPSELSAEAAMLDLTALVEHPWQWIAFSNPVESFDVEMPASYLLQFNGDGTVNVVADCNNAAGDYTADGSSLTIEIGPMTMAACPPESRSDQFVQLLGGAAIYFFADGNLHIDLMADGGTMVFAPAEAELVAADDEGALADFQPRYEPVDDCFASPSEGLELAVEYDCGYIVVPEFYQDESSRMVKVPFLRFNSGQGTAASPVLLHPGGPGQSHINELIFSAFNIMFSDVINDRDVIFMDPRGSEHADTFLDCPAWYSLNWQAYDQELDQETGEALVKETLQECIDGFRAQGVNLDAYNSLELAGDVNSVRQALGYEQIIYFGTSYGGQLGQHVMRDYPNILEAAILNGAPSLSRKSWIEDAALNVQDAFDNLAALCASEGEEKCIEAFPDFPGQLEALLEQLDDDTFPYTYTDPDDPSLTIEVEITPNNLASFIHALMGDKNGVFNIPNVINTFSQPDQFDVLVESLGEEAVQKIIASRDLTKGGEALLLHLAVVCGEDTVKSEDELILEDASEFATLLGRGEADFYLTTCPVVDVQELPEATDEPVTTAIPTLLLSGGVDVAVPAYHSQLVADSLPNATHVIFPGHTHDQLGGLSPCVKNVFTQFIADPVAELDTSCLATPDTIGFILPDGTTTHPPEEEEAMLESGDEPSAGSERSLPEELVAQLDAFLLSQVYSEGGNPKAAAPGLILLVDTPDGHYLKAAGVASLDDGHLIRADDSLEIGSNTKSMTIVLLMQLVEEGLLSLDDPLSQWLPEQAASFPNGDQMTLRQLAQHTAGLYDYADNIIAAGIADTAAMEASFMPEELVQEAIDNGTPYFAPGAEEQWHYSNTGYVLLGLIIEQVTGETMGDLYQTRIFDPLGMETAVFITGVPETGDIDTNGYWWTEDGEIIDTTNWNASQGWAAGAVAMSAADLATYAKALGAGELFQNPDTLQEMLTWEPAAKYNVGGPYGLGLIDFAGDGTVWGHGGQTLGFQSIWFVDPVNEIVVVGLTNSATYSADNLLNVRNILAGDTAQPVSAVTLLPAGDLVATTWKWNQFVTPVETTDITDNDETAVPTLVIAKDKSVTVNSIDCDTAFGTYTTDSLGQVDFDIDPASLTCDADSLAAQFVQHLNDATSWHFANGQLLIELPADSGTLIFDQ